MQMEHTIQIEAPIERVWALTTDVERWPDTTPTMTRVETLDAEPLQIGSEARIKQPGQPSRVWTVGVLDDTGDDRTFSWSTRAFGCTMTGTHTLRSTPAGTANTLALDLQGRLAGVVGRLFGRPMRRSLEKENAGFKHAAEANADVAR